MDISNHVVSFELAKQLYDLGIRIDSCHYWVHYKKRLPKAFKTREEPFVWQRGGMMIGDHDYQNKIPAPLLSELLEVMPDAIEESHWLDFKKYKGYSCCYTDDVFYSGGSGNEENPCNAVAKTLIWLVENGHYAKEEVNERKQSE